MMYIISALIALAVSFGGSSIQNNLGGGITTFQGGTGSTSPSGILYGDETIRLKTLGIGSGLSFSSGTLSATGGSGGTGNVSTSTSETAGRLAYWTSTGGTPALLGEVATTTLTASSPLALSNAISVIGASASDLSLDTSGTWTGNAGTASALAANGANCSAGSYPLGVDASGAAEDCTDATTEINSAISTHTGDTDAHQDLVTLSGTPDYITLSGQDIVRGTIDFEDDTNAVGGDGITITGDSIAADLGTSIDSAEIEDSAIVNADINGSAAIAYSKLNLTDSLLAADLDATNAESDNDIITYDNSSGGFSFNSGPELCEAITGSADLCDGSDDGSGGGGGDLSTTTEKVGAGAADTVSYVTDEFMLGGSASTSAEFLFDYASSTLEIRNSNGGTTTLMSTGDEEAVRIGEADQNADLAWAIGEGIELDFGTAGDVIMRGLSSVAEFVTSLTVTISGTLTLTGNFIFDGQTFDSLTDDATLENNSGDLRVVDVNCTDCLSSTEIDSTIQTALGNEAGLYAALSDVTQFWEAGDTINSGTLALGSLSFTGTLPHENGGLEADVSAFSGLLAISGGSTSEVDAKSELEAQIADVSDFAEADGDTYTGTHDATGATFKQQHYPAFTWPGTATTTTATTTVPIGTAGIAQQFNWADCRVTSGTGGIEISDGTNDSNHIAASTTEAQFAFTSNNSFTQGERREVLVGPLTAAQVTCTLNYEDS